MTLRIYTSEYNSLFIEQLANDKIEGLFTAEESTKKVLIVEGSQSDLEKLQGLMYAEPNKIKEVFPSFLTEEDMAKDAKKMKEEIYKEMLTKLCGLATKYNHTGMSIFETEEFTALYAALHTLEK